MTNRNMDPDRYQMRDLKRRVSTLERRLGRLQDDLRRDARRIDQFLEMLKHLSQAAPPPPPSS